MKPLLLAAALLMGGGVAVASGPLTVDAAWARATPPHADTAAVYLTIADAGPPDRLLGASTPVAASASLHESRAVGGVMQMRPVDGVEVTPGREVTLAPGGLHLMLMGLRAPLKAGQRFSVTLRFEKAGAVTVEVSVQKIGATMAPMPGMEMN